METKRDDQVIYLTDLLFAALYRWRAIVAIALVAALLLGGYGLISGRQTDACAEANYQTALAEYQLNLDVLTAKQALMEKSLADQEAYLTNSIFINLNPYAFYEATLTLYADTGYQIAPDQVLQDPDKTAAVLAAYTAAFYAESTTKEIAAALGTQSQYAVELITCLSDPAAGTITVSVRCTTKEQADAVLAKLAELAKGYDDAIDQSVCEHTGNAVNQSVACKADATLAAKKTELTDSQAAMQKALKEAKQQLATLVPPTPVKQSTGDLVKDIVVFAVVGLVLGAVVGAAFFCVMHIISGKVYSAKALAGRTGVKVLCSVSDKNCKCKIDNLLRRLEGRCDADADTQMKLLAASLENRCKDANKILLTGEVKEDARKALVKALESAGIAAVEADSLCTSAEAQKALSESDAVVLVAQCQVSRYATVAAEADIIRDCGKTLIGCVVLGG